MEGLRELEGKGRGRHSRGLVDLKREVRFERRFEGEKR